MKGRNAQVARIYKILTLLEQSRQGLTAFDMARELSERGFEISQRTIYRDLDALRAAGFPVEEAGKTTDHGSRWKLPAAQHILALTSQEIFALSLAPLLIDPGQELHQQLNSITHKVFDQMGPQFAEHFREARSHTQSAAAWSSDIDSQTLDVVRAACAEKQVLSATYYSASRQSTSTRRFGPQFLYFARGSMYLVAEDLADHQIKVFSLSRMRDAELVDESYAGAEVDPREFFTSAFGVFRADDMHDITLRFSAELATYIREKQWHASQITENQPDGRLVVRLKLGITPELIQWILGFGTRVEVIEPPLLRSRLRAESQAVTDLYSTVKKAV